MATVTLIYLLHCLCSNNSSFSVFSKDKIDIFGYSDNF